MAHLGASSFSSVTTKTEVSCYFNTICTYSLLTVDSFNSLNLNFIIIFVGNLIKSLLDHNLVHIMMRRKARPTADIEARVPIQYFITSNFAASSCAFTSIISWTLIKKRKSRLTKIINHEMYSSEYLVFLLYQVCWSTSKFLNPDESGHPWFPCIYKERTHKI